MHPCKLAISLTCLSLLPPDKKFKFSLTLRQVYVREFKGMEALSERTLAVSVLRTYADRVRDTLLGIELDWTHVPVDSNDVGSFRMTERNNHNNKRPRRTSLGSCTIIPTKLLKGGRKNRRGFALMILEGVTTSVDACCLPLYDKIYPRLCR
jgi:hypothetical protein